jgi:hypothetical protein
MGSDLAVERIGVEGGNAHDIQRLPSAADEERSDDGTASGPLAAVGRKVGLGSSSVPFTLLLAASRL